MLTLESLSLLCSLLQIVGFALIVLREHLPSYVGAFISVTGLAAVVKALIPAEGGPDALTVVAAVAGIAIIIWGAFLTQKR